jgi:hypothetical protein
MLINGKLARLGKAKAVTDSRTLKLSNYIRKAALPPVPPEVSWITKLAAAQALPMYLNDSEGDCVAAAAGHMIEQWNFYAGHPAQPSDADIQKSYEDVGGFSPGNPSTDNGMDMLSYLNYWRQTGLGGHKILAFMSVDWTNEEEVRSAVKIFGNVYLGVQLPVSAQGQSAWTVPPGGASSTNGAPGSWGGHCIPAVAMSPHSITVVTWGSLLKMSHNFLQDYCDEAFAVLAPDWLGNSGVSPDGLDLAQLKADLATVTAHK